MKQDTKKSKEDVKIKKESRSERTKARVKQSKDQDSDEGSPERRLETTPKKRGKAMDEFVNDTVPSKELSSSK